MQLISAWTIPRMKIVSAANCSQHHFVKAKRNKTQKGMMKAYFLKYKPQIILPCTIRLTRVAPRELDPHDNLPMSLKWIVDSLADCIFPGRAAGRADNSKKISWIYNQEKGKPKEYALKIEIFKND